LIGIIDYGLGNISSVVNAFEAIGVPVKLVQTAADIRMVNKLVLPGVGAFGEGMSNLRKLGLISVLKEEVIGKKKPFLGICLGMQLICKKSFERGEWEGLGWVNAEVVKFDKPNLRVPHVGWNDVMSINESPLFSNGRKEQTFYFVHSYFVKPKDNNLVVGVCNYGGEFCAALQKDNIFAIQFHPEKSQYEGLELLRKFAEYSGESEPKIEKDNEVNND
jgi:imidazole glycerol-phosphate synthase subunit HisH